LPSSDEDAAYFHGGCSIARGSRAFPQDGACALSRASAPEHQQANSFIRTSQRSWYASATTATTHVDHVPDGAHEVRRKRRSSASVRSRTSLRQLDGGTQHEVDFDAVWCGGRPPVPGFASAGGRRGHDLLRTAWLSQPYLTPPEGQPATFAGYPALRDEQAIAAISRAYQNGWQILVHTNGDAAIDQLLLAVTAASARYPGRDRRTVMIHGQTLREDQVPRLKALGIFPALFPMHTFYWGDWYVDTVLGPERAANISPTGWMTKNGMIFTSHHDAPVAFPDTMRVLSATVNRTTRSGQVLSPEHRVEPIVALKAMTLWAAYQHFEEKSKGSIEVGKLADIKVMETIKKGKSIYRLDPSKTGESPVPCMESSRCSERFAAYRASSPLTEMLGPAPHVHQEVRSGTPPRPATRT